MTDASKRTVRIPAVRVIVTPPGGAPVERSLEINTITIGQLDCDITVNDAKMSRRHCSVTRTDKGVVLRDLDSKNGTFIGEVQVVEAILPPDVVVTIGGSQLVVRAAGLSSVEVMSSATSFGEAIGRSVAMRVLFARLERAAATIAPILLLGETGTGKEILARAIHAASPRKDGPFVVLDCSALSPNLIDSELFGHMKGAFTGAISARAGYLEEADSGTLFIDEVGELPLDLQPKLLRALELGEVRRLGSTEPRKFDARIVAATHRDLRACVARGTFREDLYYRLAVVTAMVPPLRAHKEDIEPIAERFLAAQAPRRSLADLPPHTLDLLTSHTWPGNVRELRNTVLRLAIFPELGREAIESALASSADPSDIVGSLVRLPLREARELVLERFESGYIRAMLKLHKGSISRTAEAMNISRQHLHGMMDRYGIATGGK